MPITFEEWLKRNGIEKREYIAELKKQGKTDREIAFLWYRVEDLYLFETNQ